MHKEESHPSRVRGLKSDEFEKGKDDKRWSHPSRVRGLKCIALRDDDGRRVVAPFTGAWIEIWYKSKGVTKMATSHPSRVRGLK